MDGVYLGVNAVPDIRLVVDCPHGCFFKCERIALNHDLTSDLFDPLGRHRIVQTGIEFSKLPFGTEDIVEQMTRRLLDKEDTSMVFLTQASMVLVTSNDLEGLAQRLEDDLAVPVVYLPPDPFDGDYLDGFDRFLSILADRLVHGIEGPPDDDAVVIVGYFPDRLEEDHLANIGELKSLIEALGLQCSGVLCNGESTTAMREACRAGTVVSLPYGRAAARIVAEATGADVIDTDLPIGLEGTTRWITHVGNATGREDRAAFVIDRGLDRAVRTLDRARSRFLEDRVAAIAADPHWAPGLVEYLTELGIRTPVVAVRSRHDDAANALRSTVERLSLAPKVLVDHDTASFREAIETADDGHGVDVVLGSSSERDAALMNGPGFIELGFPSYMHHALFPRPLLGFNGALRLAEELVNTVRLREHTGNLD